MRFGPKRSLAPPLSSMCTGFLSPATAANNKMSAVEACLSGGIDENTETLPNAPGGGVAARPRRQREETARLGKEIYERDIRGQVEADRQGEVVAIDVDSRNWAVADGEIAAVDRLSAMRPSAVNVLCERVGHRALRSFGAGSLRRTG